MASIDTEKHGSVELVPEVVQAGAETGAEAETKDKKAAHIDETSDDADATDTPRARAAGVSDEESGSNGRTDEAGERGETGETDLAPFATDDAAVYHRFSRGRKRAIVGVLALCGIVSPISSTGSLTAVPDIAASFGTTSSVVEIGNALYIVMMAISAFLWGPLSTLSGRQLVLFTSVVSFFAFSVGTALAPNLAAFFVFRLLTGFGGTGLLIIGAGCIGDLYKPTERATALSLFSSGVTIGPAFGPLIGGIIVTYGSWRDIFWFQSGLSGLGAVLAILLVPETIHTRGLDSVPKNLRLQKILVAINPVRMLGIFRNVNMLVVALCSSAVTWNMYSFLTPIVYVINPRFGLTTPLQSGLFYLAPGAGYLLGTVFGGRFADFTTKRWIRRRGHRVPEDRLNAALPWLGFGIPASMLIYGWCLRFKAGGIPVIVIFMFIQGFSQLMIFPALNTYCLDKMPTRSAEAISCNYMSRYIFAAVGNAVVLPAIHGIGIGWFCTITTCFMLVSAGLLLWVIRRAPA